MALVPASMEPSIHSDVLARYEGGALEIEHCVDDIRNFTDPSQRVKLRQLRMISLSVHRRVNDGGRDRVETDVLRRVFQRLRPKFLRAASTTLMAVSFLLTSPSTRTR